MKPTIIDLLNQSVEKYAQNPFLWEKATTEFIPTTYLETRQQTHLLAASLIKLGLEAGEKVALLSEGRNAWIIGELGILHTGAVIVPLSIKLEESNDLIFRLEHSEAKYILVSGGQLSKIRAVVENLPQIKKVIIFDEQPEYKPNEISLQELLEWGTEYLKANPKAVEERAKAVQPNDLANISYTRNNCRPERHYADTPQLYIQRGAGTHVDEYPYYLSHPHYFATRSLFCSCGRILQLHGIGCKRGYRTKRKNGNGNIEKYPCKYQRTEAEPFT